MTLIAEPFFICLLASMVWAPIVLMTALRFQKNEAYADKVWPIALLIAALPALAAPVAAALGVSLRSAPPVLPAPVAPPAEIAAAITPEVIAVTEASPVTLAAVFEAAAALYLYGFLMFLALGTARHVWFSYRAGYAVEMDHPRLEAAFEDWRRRMNIRRKPRFAFTDAVSSVCVHGYFRPVVLMPEALLDRVSEQDVELMVAHEMAHIRRGDTTLFALCTAVKAVFWFNPFIQRIAAQATLAAEQAADALVIASGAERRRYARCFVEGLRFAAGAKFGERELVPSFTPFDRRSRRERLDAILSGRSTSGLDWRARLGIAGGVIAAAALAFAQAALAVAPKAEDALTHAPVEGKTVKTFTQRSVDLDSKAKDHPGVDIAASRGTIVRAAGDGKVVEATNRYRGQAAWGNVVVIDHGHGLVTRYAHLDRYKVKKGDSVKAGDTIGRVGSTGRTGGRAHLHFEVIRDGAPIDPLPVLAAKPMQAPEPLGAPAPAPKAAPLKDAPPIEEARRFAMVAPSVGVKIANGADSLKVPVSPSPPAAVFDVMDVGAMSEEIAELIGASTDLADIQFKLRAFDADDLQAMTMTLGADARRVMEESARAAAEAVKRNAEIAKREGAKARAEAEREIERALERAERERERAYEHAKRERERAREEAQQAREKAQEERDRAQKERDRAQKERDRAQKERERAAQERIERAKERELERAERDAERNRERRAAKAERDRERLAEKAERERAEAEREMSRAIARFESDDANRGRTLAAEKKALATQEKALRKAQQDLDRQLAELERRRAELERAEEQRN